MGVIREKLYGKGFYSLSTALCLTLNLVPAVGVVLQNVLHPTVQDLTQGVQGGGRDGLAVLHPVEGVSGYALLIDQIVLGHVFAI